MYPHCVHPGSTLVRFLACEFLASRLKLFANLDEHTLPSGLAELEQLHVEPNSDHFTPQLHILQTMKSWLGPGNETRV